MIYNLSTSKKDYHFVNIITNIWQCKMMLWFQEYRDFMQQSARSQTFQNVGSILLMKLSLQVSFGSYLNSLFKTTIVSLLFFNFLRTIHRNTDVMHWIALCDSCESCSCDSVHKSANELGWLHCFETRYGKAVQRIDTLYWLKVKKWFKLMKVHIKKSKTKQES